MSPPLQFSASSSLAFKRLVNSACWRGLAFHLLWSPVGLTPRVTDLRVLFLTSLVFIVTIGVGVQGGPAPELIEDESSWTSDYKLVGKPTFNEAMGALTTLIYTYCGTPAFFNIAAEMKDPKQYTRALALCQGFVTIVYIVVGIIIYYFCGSYVASPALGSAGALIKMVSYGFALPGLLVSAILPIHVSSTGVTYTPEMANVSIAFCQVYIHALLAWFRASDGQQHYSLGNLAWLDPHYHGRIILHC